MKKRIGIAVSVCALAALALFSREAADGCREAIELCLRGIVPALLPYFILSALMTRLGLPRVLGRLIAPAGRVLFNVSGPGISALPVGLLGGYPLGAAYIADMERSGEISIAEGERLLFFCSNSGPAFILGALGQGVFSSAELGLKLYAAHASAAVIAGIIGAMLFKGEPKAGSQCRDDINTQELSFAEALTSSVGSAMSSMLNVCGFVMCFSVLIALFDAGGGFSVLTGRISVLSGLELRQTGALLRGLLELGNGVFYMEGASGTRLDAVIAALILSFGGASVHFQTMAVISDSKLKGSLYLPGCLVKAILSSLIMWLIY